MVAVPWREIHEFEHVVQFCETDEFLITSVGKFISDGLKQGDVCIVLATQAHRDGFDAYLKAEGLAVSAARARGRYIPLDAASTLSQIMVDGSVDPARFYRVIGEIIRQAAKSGRRVRAFGELVALLCAEGKRAEAIHLEGLWNELAQQYAFSLFCAYPMASFDGEAYEVDFAEICRQHERVIPSESYSTLTDPNERLRAITLLQQKSHSLDIEIAERKRIAEALEESEARFRFLAESMPQKIFTARPNGEVDYFNPQWTQFTGLLFEEIRGWGWTQFIHPDDVEENVRRWQHSIDTGEPFYFEHRFRGADGTYRWHVSRAIPIRDTRGTITMWIGSNTDIDEQKCLEERKDAFISMASHELKTPVTSLKGFTHILQNRLRKRGDEEALGFLASINKQLNRLTRLINDLLDITRVQQGRLDYEEELFDLDTLVRETIENLQAITSTHRLILEESQLARVYADKDRIAQVLTNLITNAIKYSPDADRVIIHLCSDGANAIVSVQDFGIGIAPDHQAHIFERFYQGADATGKTFPGLGIGLYLSNEIIKRHCGRIRVESEKGTGSTFSFSLPLATDDRNDSRERI
jgi:PAS domain S-box-containing protein